MGDMFCLCILHHNCMRWHTHNSWSCCVLLEVWFRRDIFKESYHSWILSWYHMDYSSFESFWLGLWYQADWLWWVFRYCSLLFKPDFLNPMLCSLGSCCNGGCLLSASGWNEKGPCWFLPKRRQNSWHMMKTYLLVEWLSPEGSGSMGDMLDLCF